MMAFNLSFPSTFSESSSFSMEAGNVLYVLGPNGSGKSSLMHHLARQNHGRSRKISAHRQTWMQSDAIDLTPSKKVRTEQNILSDDAQAHSRYRDDYASARASMTIYDLIDAENVRAREITAAVDGGETELAESLSKNPAPITQINTLLACADLPIQIAIERNERLLARKHGSPEYSSTQLSDGERNAILLSGAVLTARPNTLILIDEPERHLHRSIISSLLIELFRLRADCGFVISTHDHGLPIDGPDIQILLLRNCSFGGSNVKQWDADLLRSSVEIPDTLKQDLVGSRRTVVFVEGTARSLDRGVYEKAFPTASVVPKGNCRDVRRAVTGLRAVNELHWLHVHGIVDGDAIDPDTDTAQSVRGIHVLPYYSVESIYYHPTLMEKIAARQTRVTGGDIAATVQKATECGLAAVKKNRDHLCLMAARAWFLRKFHERLPTDEQVWSGAKIGAPVRQEEMIAEAHTRFDGAVERGEWEEIIRFCPIRESAAPREIVRAMGLGGTVEYEAAVRHLLSSDEDAREFVRSLLPGLATELGTAA